MTSRPSEARSIVDLLPCPHCGSKAVLEYINKAFHVECIECRCGTCKWGKRDWAVRAWNKRLPNILAKLGTPS
jgi:hypothetical protein